MSRSCVLIAALLLASCGDSRSSRGAPAPARSPEEGPSAPRASEPPPPPAGNRSGAPERVSFETRDGVTLVGTLRAGGEPSAPAVVLVHQLSSTRAEWEPIVAGLSEVPGMTTLAIDMRGHGESTAGAAGTTLDWHDFDRERWPDTRLDVIAAIDFLAARGDLRPSRFVAVGSSIGSSAVLAAAAEDTRIERVALLSPGRAYHGFDAITPVPALGARPLLAVAAQREASAVETAQQMARIATTGREIVYAGGNHGVRILEEAPQMKDDLVAFLRETVPPQ